MEMFNGTAFAETLKFLAEGEAGGFEFKTRKGFASALKSFESKLDTLSKDQGVVIGEILLGQYDVLTVTGKAGTGKTHTLKLAKQLLEELYDVKVVIVAPTGVAGQIAGGATINSRGLGMGNLLPRGVQEEGEGWKRPGIETCVGKGRQHLMGNDSLVVFIEEAFATSAENVLLYWQLCQLLRPGEVKFVCFGDPGQLAPVNKVREGSLQIVSPIWETAKFVTMQGDKYFFQPFIKVGPYLEGDQRITSWRSKRMALTTNHRQKNDRAFIEALNFIRLGGKLEGPASILLKRFMPRVQPSNPDQVVHIYANNRMVAQVNEEAVKKAKKAKQKCKVYKAIYSGDISKVDIFPAKLEMELAVGLPFMVRQNISDLGVYNGTIGIIRELRDKSILLDVKGRTVELGYTEVLDVPTDGRGKPVCTIQMLPGHLGVGITGHKCQGLTIEGECVVHLSNQDYWLRNEAGAMYVMLSRVTNINRLFIDSSPALVNSLIKASPAALAFIKESEMEMAASYGIQLEEQVTQEHIDNMTPVFAEKKQQEDGSWLYLFNIHHADGTTKLVAFSNQENTSLIKYAVVGDDEADTVFLESNECPYHEDCCKALGLSPTVEQMVRFTIAGVTVPVVAVNYDESYSVDYEENLTEVVEVTPVIEVPSLIKKETSQLNLNKVEDSQPQPEVMTPSAELIKREGVSSFIVNGFTIPLSPYILREDSSFKFELGALLLEVSEVNPSYILLKGNGKYVVEVVKPNDFAFLLEDSEKFEGFKSFVQSERFGGLVMNADRGFIKTEESKEVNVPVVDENLNKTAAPVDVEESDEFEVDNSLLDAMLNTYSLEPEGMSDEDLLIKKEEMGMNMVNIAVIGTAGRKEDAPHLNKVVYDAMYTALLSQLKGIPVEKRRLVSGGSSYADHLAVRAYLEGECSALTLHLPRRMQGGKFQPVGDESADTINYYHQQFSRKCFVDASVSLGELGLAVNKGAVVTTVSNSVQGYKSMFERNEKIAESSDMLIAFTVGDLRGGTKQTWDKHVEFYPQGKRVHVNVLDLIKTPTVSVSAAEVPSLNKRVIPRPVIRR